MRTAPEPLGPISPELVLVSPDLAALIAGTPDAIVVDESPAAPDNAEPEQEVEVEAEPRTAGGAPRGTVRYDTTDLALERHGVTLELESSGELRHWRLTLPRGEKVEMPAAPSGVPRRIAALLDTLLGDDELRRVPTRSTNPEIQHLEAQLLEQRRSLVAHDAGTRLAADAENLHQLRVASRRVRAFLRVARELVDAEWAAQVNTALRDLGRASGDARDADVLLEHLQHEAPTLGAPDAEAALQLIRMLERDRDELQAELEATLDSRTHRAMLEQLGLPVEEAAEPSQRTLADLAARELRRLVAQVRALGKTPADEKLHELRIRVKRVRYAAELGGLRGGAPHRAGDRRRHVAPGHPGCASGCGRRRAADPRAGAAQRPARGCLRRRAPGRAAEAAPQRASAAAAGGLAPPAASGARAQVASAGSRTTRATPSASAARATALATAGTTSRLKTLGMM